MHANNVRRRSRFGLLRLLLLVGAVVYLWVALPPAMREWREEQRLEYLVTACAVEEIEVGIADGELENSDGFREYLTSFSAALFKETPSLARLHLWVDDHRGSWIFTGDGEQSPRKDDLADTVTLPAGKMLRGKFADDAYALYDLATEQRYISAMLEELASSAKPDDARRVAVYSLQRDAVDVAKSLVNTHPLIEDALTAMKDASDELEMEDQTAMRTALDASQDAEAFVSLALEDHRASEGNAEALPAPDAKRASKPANWWGYLWPGVRGRSLLIPLYQPADSETLIEQVGIVELTFYHRPSEALAGLGWRWLIPAGLLLAGALGCRQRREEEE